MANFEDEIDPVTALKVIEMRAQRLCSDALDNFLIARGLAAQGEDAMADKHMAQVDALNKGLAAVLAVKDRYTARLPQVEVGHGHDH